MTAALAAGLFAGSANAQWVVIWDLLYRASVSTETRCEGDRCSDIRFGNDAHDNYGLTLGALYPLGPFELGASLDADFGIGATLRAQHELARDLRLGVGVGGREFEPAPRAGARDRVSTDGELVPYVDVSLTYRMFHVRWARVRGDFSGAYQSFTGNDADGNPTYGSPEPFDHRQTNDSVWVGVSLRF